MQPFLHSLLIKVTPHENLLPWNVNSTCVDAVVMQTSMTLCCVAMLAALKPHLQKLEDLFVSNVGDYTQGHSGHVLMLPGTSVHIPGMKNC